MCVSVPLPLLLPFSSLSPPTSVPPHTCPARLPPPSQAEFEGARSEMEREAKRAAKVEHKCNILLGGLQQRDDKFQQQLGELHTQLLHQAQELTCFQVSHAA